MSDVVKMKFKLKAKCAYCESRITEGEECGGCLRDWICLNEHCGYRFEANKNGQGCGNCGSQNVCRYDPDDEDDGFENCECGYTHHYEDKCPNEATAKHYTKWRKEE